MKCPLTEAQLVSFDSRVEQVKKWGLMCQDTKTHCIVAEIYSDEDVAEHAA